MKRMVWVWSVALLLLGSISFTPTVSAGDVSGNPNFYTSLFDIVNTKRNYNNGQGGISKFLQKIPGLGGGGLDVGAGAKSLSDFIVEIIVKIVIPIFVFIGILLAILGFFKIMTSNTAEELKKGRDFILRGVIGVLLMVAAGRIVATLVGTDGAGGIIGGVAGGAAGSASGTQLAGKIYGEIIFPLLKMIFSIILGIMFILAISKGFKFLFSADETAQKQSLQILIFTVVGILVIILAKTLVESVYGPYEEVVNGGGASVKPGVGVDVGQIGEGIFTNPNFEVLYVVLNRLLGFATIMIVGLIIYLGYLLLMMPTSEETMTKIKKAIGWIAAGILLMGAAYLVANFVIIK